MALKEAVETKQGNLKEEIEALFGNFLERADKKIEEQREFEFQEDTRNEFEQEREESSAKRQKKASKPSSQASEGERPREIKKEMGINEEFELLGFISRSLEKMGWDKYFYDGIDFIHADMVSFAYNCPMVEVRAGHFVIKFDADTINVKIKMDMII